MVLKSTTASDVSVYQVSGSNVSRSMPDWIAKKRRRALKNDADYQNRVELVQDFEFSEASNKIKVTKDGQYAMATGTYKPQIHVYDFANLSLKFERHTDCENVDFLLLSDDWTKSIHLQNDRSIEFQVKGGMHYRARIPKFGRAMCYNEVSCDLTVAASGNEIYRLNLEQGRFMKPFQVESDLGVNAVDINPVHGLLGAGLEDGTVEFWDPRAKQRVIKMRVNDGSESATTQISCLKFRNDGLNMACGTSNGVSMIYDLRTAQPLLTKDQGYGFEIKKMIWLDENNSTSNKILTSDRKIAKIWDRNTGKAFASMEPSVDINDVEYLPNTGMFFMANEGIQMHTYYIPELGPAPRWCSFLDNITEELEEKPSDTVYSNYRFITKQDVSKLNITHLVGTKVLRSYMHGYFIDSELYDKVNLIANPNSIQDQRDREIRKRIEKERESRIRSTGAVSNTKIKVNRDYINKLEKKMGTEAAEEVVNDDRFSEMFQDPMFQIDTESHDYKQLNPVQNAHAGPKPLTAAEESDEERLNGSDSDSDKEDESDSDSEEEKNRQEAQRNKIKDTLLKRKKDKRLQKEEEKMKFLESNMKPLGSVEDSFNSGRSSRNESFGRQVAKANKIYKKEHEKNKDIRIHKNARGEAEMTFIPQVTKKTKNVRFNNRNNDNDDDENEGESSLKRKDKQKWDGRRRASKNVFRGM